MILNGGSPHIALENGEVWEDLRRLSIYLRWIACSVLPDDFVGLRQASNKGLGPRDLDRILDVKETKASLSSFRRCANQR